MTIVALRQDFSVELSGEQRLRRLAREIAMDIHEIEDILKRYNVEENEWVSLSHDTTFKRMLQQEMITWHSPMNTRERTKVKIEALIEDALEVQYANLVDPRFSDTAKVQLLQALGKMVGYGSEKENVAGGPGVAININIDKGGGHTIEAQHVPPVIDLTSEGNE